MTKRYHAMILVRGLFSNVDECEAYFEDVDTDWYYKEDEQDGRKVVPIFPHLRKMRVHQHRYFGCILSDDSVSGSDKFTMAQIVLEVSGNSESDVHDDLLNGEWIRPQSGLTVYPPVLSLKGYEDESLSNIEWEIRSGGT